MYKMYNAQWDEGSDDDKNSLFSSFWSDGEKHEEEEEEEEIIERMVIEDEAKFVAEAEASPLEASEEDKPKLKDQGNFTKEGSKDGSNVVEEEEKTERVVNEEDSVFVAEDEDSLQKDSEEEIEQVVNDEDSNLVSEEEHSLQEDSEKEDGSKGERPELDSEGNSSSESYNRQSVDKEAEKMEHVVVETEDDLQEDSEDEKPEVNNKENLTSGSSEEGSDDDYDGDDDDEEENERVFSEEDLFQPVVEADDPLLVASEEKNRHNDKEVQIEPKVKEEDFKTLYKTDSLQKDSAKEKPEENNHKNFPTWSWEDDDDDEQNCTISCSSTAPSLITSGYGTYRLEEQEGGDHTITEFDQDSRGDLSEMRDNEEDVESFSSYGGFDVERDLRENQNENKLDFPVASCERGGRREEVDTEDLKSNNNKDLTEEKCEDLHTESENKEGQQRQPYTAIYEDTLLKLEKHLEAIQSDPEEGGGYEKLHEEEQNHVKKKAKSKVELEDSDESLNNKDIKFIDSKVDFNWAMYKKMLEEWEGNLRQKTDTVSCLEERLAEVDLSTSPQRDLETEHEDVVSQRDTLSSEADGISLSAFESYIRGMVGNVV
ncbi:hypothetical protein JOB18_020233 [Solea senegalensis]|uniref:Uncharacterized protein n=1 Tax=Solea senegalensis TaxID=28829 RepID=A0AAV6Q8P5_SOLSE|nr:hypothetical protein JOB18_020233 [Solea senegalensis]